MRKEKVACVVSPALTAPGGNFVQTHSWDCGPLSLQPDKDCRSLSHVSSNSFPIPIKKKKKLSENTTLEIQATNEMLKCRMFQLEGSEVCNKGLGGLNDIPQWVFSEASEPRDMGKRQKIYQNCWNMKVFLDSSQIQPEFYPIGGLT